MTEGDTVELRFGESRPDEPWRLAVLLSGSGRTLANLLEATSAGELPARIVAVVSSVPNVRGLEIAAEAGLPAHLIPRRAFASDEAFSTAVYEALAPYRPDLLRNRGELVRPELLTQLGVREGDQILIGTLAFTIRGVIEHEPGRRVGGFSLGPRVLI